MSDPQIDAEGRRVLTEVPTEPGFYWWREKPEYFWRMIQLVSCGVYPIDLQPALYAYDVEFAKSIARPLRKWENVAEVGEWVACLKPDQEGNLGS